MKRALIVGLAGLVGAAGVAAVTPVRELPAAWSELNATAARTTEINKLSALRESQQAATDYVIARLADGRFTLTEATALLESNTAGRPAFLEQLARVRPETTDHDRLAGYAVERAKERLGDDPGQVSALVSRLGAEGK